MHVVNVIVSSDFLKGINFNLFDTTDLTKQEIFALYVYLSTANPTKEEMVDWLRESFFLETSINPPIDLNPIIENIFNYIGDKKVGLSNIVLVNDKDELTSIRVNSFSSDYLIKFYVN